METTTTTEVMGEVVDTDGTPPEGFTLEAEASRPDPVVPGIVQRIVEPEPDDDDDDLQALATDEDGDAIDDDAIDDPEDDAPLDDI